MFTQYWLLFLLAGCAHAVSTPPTTTPAEDHELRTRALIAQMAAGDFRGACTDFNARMTKGLGPSELAAAWASIVKAGSFSGITGLRTEQTNGFQVVVARTHFGSTPIDIRVSFDTEDKIGGLFFKPAKEEATTSSQRDATARSFLAQLSSGAFDEATRSFDATMTSAMSAKQLEELWRGVEKRFGGFQTVKGVRLVPVGAFIAAKTACTYSNGVATWTIALDGKNHVAGIQIAAGDGSGNWESPPYAQPDRFVDRETSVGNGPALPGHLTLPQGTGPFPAMILVHGSGPNDEDESIGPNKTFKDLAYGLASRGIAVLRYQKRTFVSPEGVSTVNEEYFQSIRAAIELLEQTPGIDRARIVVVGHSEGGYLAPWIGRDNPKLAGLVVMAGNTRPFFDLVVDQFQYFLSLTRDNAELKKALDEAKKDRARAEAADLRPDDKIWHGTGAYHLALRGYRPAQVAASLSIPMLILQGERDYQVSPKNDFPLWETALSARKNATLKLYPKLNHFFIPGEGTPSPGEYEILGHVPENVIADIANWVRALPGAAASAASK